MPEFLHRRRDFKDLLSVVAGETGITPTLIEKDYWIMHCLWGLKKQGFQFELKGGTSLSKGFGIIKRFSEDIDIHIQPPPKMGVSTNKKQIKTVHVESRRRFYDWLPDVISIPDVTTSRATEYDDERMRSGGIKLVYETQTAELHGVKAGILLEAGFDDTTPNVSTDISSWAFDKALPSKVDVIDNRAFGILCYNPEYTFVEKLQTISTKFRKLQETGNMPSNLLRHYYDVYALLNEERVRQFIGTEKYEKRKRERFGTKDELGIAGNAAFVFKEKDVVAMLQREYERTSDLYYQGQPAFAVIIAKINEHIDKL